ncbi:MAG: DUF1801 domain-containing protein [Pseudomonadota bacterium]
MAPQIEQSVCAAFDAAPTALRLRMLALRDLIFETADAMDGVGPLTETLKWGEPAYLTEASKSGSTIRIGWKKASPTRYALYFNCNTSLIETFRAQFGDDLTFEGNRAIVFDKNDALPSAMVASCIASALTYHRDKKAAS